MNNNNIPYYISLDTEAGGIGSDKSLLTAYLAVFDKDLNLLDDLYLNLKPDDGIYHVTGKAMEINGINLVEHDKIAMSYKEAKSLLYLFLAKNKGENHLKPIGQNVKFDIIKLTENIIHVDSWHQFVSYRTLDTGSISGFLIEAGYLPKDLNAGLKAMAEYFGVGIQNDTGHDAKDDVMLTVGVYKSLLNILNEKM